MHFAKCKFIGLTQARTLAVNDCLVHSQYAGRKSTTPFSSASRIFIASATSFPRATMYSSVSATCGGIRAHRNTVRVISSGRFFAIQSSRRPSIAACVAY